MEGTEAFQVSSVNAQVCGLMSGQQWDKEKCRGGTPGEGTRHVTQLVATHSGGPGFNLRIRSICHHSLSMQMTLKIADAREVAIHLSQKIDAVGYHQDPQ